ncbi:hypothetical protein [Epilithonimonas bovis]|nr:hypothetical protein [Epilithonimonas bovis]
MLNKQLEKNNSAEGEGAIRSKLDLGTKFLNLFNVEAEGKARVVGTTSQKVLETFEVKTTKSIILNDIIESSREIKNFDNIQEGELIRLDNISLSLENEPELRLVKLFTSDAFKGMNVPGANGFDMNNLFNSMFKDYAYKLKGELKDVDEEILIKIPLTFESEFESSYSVDDLFIGRVSLIGLYKGKIKGGDLRNSLEFFQEIGNMQNMAIPKEEDEIQDSQYEEIQQDGFTPFISIKNDTEYHYIDILSIVQLINTQNKK